eukprot:GILK01014517.1.p2 GENE.GILK01014517.1~~GILK01014517.1.p2  ORF type:complete len:100 (-),score=6.52 GILK01014517.1:29-283(-)
MADMLFIIFWVPRCVGTRLKVPSKGCRRRMWSLQASLYDRTVMVSLDLVPSPSSLGGEYEASEWACGPRKDPDLAEEGFPVDGA